MWYRAGPHPRTWGCGLETAVICFCYLSPQLALKWSDRKRAPERMWRGAAVVHGAIAYIIGFYSQTIYSYRLDGDKWKKHSKCPHVDPGLVIINDLLTAVGGSVGGDSTKKVTTLTRNNWVETFPPMQTARERPAVVHYGDYVIAVGGDREEKGVELLHIPSLLWSTVTSLPSPLSRITATLCHDEIIAMDQIGWGWTMNIKQLLSSEIRLEGSSTALSQWTSLPQCPVGYGWGRPTLSSLSGQPLVVSRDGIFQLQERQWVRIGDMPYPMFHCIVCAVCDQMVVVGGSSTGYNSTDAVRVAVIV